MAPGATGPGSTAASSRFPAPVVKWRCSEPETPPFLRLGLGGGDLLAVARADPAAAGRRRAWRQARALRRLRAADGHLLRRLCFAAHPAALCNGLYPHGYRHRVPAGDD